MRTAVDIALPVLNEAESLEENVNALLAWLSAWCRYDWYLSIVDNGSTDDSWRIAARIAQSQPDVRALRLGKRGRGGALKTAWTSSTADILAYMDIDLSTELDALGPLLDPIAVGTADLSIGSRLLSGSDVTRSTRREVISHVYNLVARSMLRFPVRDAQCGFKAVNRKIAQTIVPLVHDDDWFFDTELLLLAWRSGHRINEVPVNWVEDDDSRVRIVTTAIDDLRGIWRLVRDHGPNGPPDRSAVIPVLETVPIGASSTGPTSQSA